jgi:acyl dehydratase
VLDKRASSSRPNAGIVSVKTIGTQQEGKTVCTFMRTILVAKRGFDVEKKANY